MRQGPLEIVAIHLVFFAWAFFVGWLDVFLRSFVRRTREEWEEMRRQVVRGWAIGYFILLGGSLVICLTDGRKDFWGFLWMVGVMSVSIPLAVAGEVVHIRRVLRNQDDAPERTTPADGGRNTGPLDFQDSQRGRGGWAWRSANRKEQRPMGEYCPHCGAELPAIRGAFCPECHSDLDETPATLRPPSGSERGHGAAEQRGDLVWHATEARVFRSMKLSWYDDQGVIDTTAEGLRFVGHKAVMRMDRVSAVQRIGPVVPWAALVSLLAGNALVLVMAKAGAFKYLTLESPMTYILLGLLDLFALFSWPMNWVKVEYLDERGQPCRAYFTAGSLLGRWTGGTGRLHALMQHQAGKRT